MELFSRSSSSLPCKAQDWLMFTIPTHFRSTATGNQMSRTIFTRAQKHGYTSEGVQSYVYKYQVQSSVALYRYWQPIIYTTNWGEIGTHTYGDVGRYGCVCEGVVGYCMLWNNQELSPSTTTAHLTLGAHAQRGLRMRVSVCLSVPVTALADSVSAYTCTLCVCLSVTALAATAFVSACNQRHLRHSFRLFLD